MGSGCEISKNYKIWDAAMEISPDAEVIINTSFNLSLEEAYGVLANAAPGLSRRLIEIGLDPKTKGYSATPAIMGACQFLKM